MDHGREFLPGAKEQLLALLSSSAAGHDSTSAATPSPPDLWPRVLGVVFESACEQKDWGLATALVRAGAKIRSLDLNWAAVEEGQGELMTALVENGAPVDTEDTYGRTFLYFAAQQGKLKTVQLLLQKGADTDLWDDHGCTPLYVAAEHGFAAVVRVLMTSGADTSLECDLGFRPQEKAVEKGRVDVVRVMMELGVDVTACVNGSTALHFARADVMIDMLVEAGADIEARDSERKTPLNRNVCRQEGIETIRAFVDHGAVVNTQDGKGNTPLHSAAHGDPEMVGILLRAGADETIVNDDGHTAADLMAERGGPGQRDLVMLNMLASAPADRAWRRRGHLLLCVARHTRESLPSTHGVAAWVLALGGQEGIFRTIVGYL